MHSISQKLREQYKKDGSLAWIICGCAFLSNAIVYGMDSSFGEMVQSIAEDFDSPLDNVAWIGSVHSSAQYLAAFLSSMAATRFGFGKIISTGVLMSTTGICLSLLTTNVSTLVVTYGILGGVGLGLIYAPASIICSFHFNKRRSLATGIAICGSGVGIVLVSELFNLINKGHGWKGCMTFCACLCPLNCLLAAITLLLPEEGQAHDISVDDSSETQSAPWKVRKSIWFY